MKTKPWRINKTDIWEKGCWFVLHKWQADAARSIVRSGLATLPARPMNPALLPFAVTCTALYLCLGLLPFTPDGVSWGDALGLLPSRLPADGFHVLPLLLALPLGFFWQGAVWPHVASARLAAAIAAFLVQGLLAVLLLLAQIDFPPRLAAPAGLLAPVLGFAAGMVLWWLLGRL
jgi:hypothetical protein